MKPLALILLLIGSVGCTSPVTTPAPEEVRLEPTTVYTTVSLYRILAVPERFDGQELMTIGYLRIGRGDFGMPIGYLFASLQDWRDDIRTNCVELYFENLSGDARLSSAIRDAESRATPSIVSVVGVLRDSHSILSTPSFHPVRKIEIYHSRKL